MRITPTSTTTEILQELGSRLQAARLQQNLTAAELARRSGVSLRSVARAEAGENISLETMIKMLRAADRLGALESFLPAPLASPLQLAEMRGHQRKRASSPRDTGTE
jgi:transcriptional regulator with XRE-family HTH domain